MTIIEVRPIEHELEVTSLEYHNAHIGNEIQTGTKYYRKYLVSILIVL